VYGRISPGALAAAGAMATSRNNKQQLEKEREEIEVERGEFSAEREQFNEERTMFAAERSKWLAQIAALETILGEKEVVSDFYTKIFSNFQWLFIHSYGGC